MGAWYAPEVEIGGKAAGIARLASLGLPVPAGFVVGPELDEAAVGALLAGLAGTGPLVVRSSAVGEDAAGRRAPGVYLSVRGVARDVGAVVAAVREVRASAGSALARAYRARVGAGDGRMAVLVQEEIAGRGLTLYTRDPGGGEHARVELAGGGTLLVERGGGRVVLGGGLGEPEVAALVAAVPVLEAAWGGPVDAEAVVSERGLVWVQARPAALWTGGARARFVAPDARVWRLDAVHNPAPLSAAQAALVRMVEAGRGSPRQAVIEGYLYVAETEAETEAGAGAGKGSGTGRGSGTGMLAVARRAVREMEALLAREVSGVDAALATYGALFECYAGRLAPALRALRRALDEVLARCLPAAEVPAAAREIVGGVETWATRRVAQLEAAGQALAGGDRGPLEALLAGPMGWLAPAWDVAVASYRERPELLETAARAAAARAAAAPSAAQSATRAGARERARQAAGERCAALARSAPPALARELARRAALAREAVCLGEADDLLFARAQQLVRRALLERGEELVRAGTLDHVDQVFDVVDLSDRNGRSHPPPGGGGTSLVPPLVIHGEARLYPLPPTAAGGLRGVAGGGRARGPACVRLTESAPPPPAHAVLVVPTIVPANAHWLLGAAALVTDHGGLLSHGAALARELGVPSVVDTGLATRTFRDGEPLVVDGETGWVWRDDA